MIRNDLANEDLIEENRSLRKRVTELEAFSAERQPGPENLQVFEAAAIVDSFLDGVLVLDRKSRVIDVNKHLEGMIGYSRKELVGKTTLALARLLTNKGLSIYWKNPLKRTEEFSSVPHEVDVFKKNGELITVRINCQQLKTDSKMMGHLIILENLTELKHKERKSNEYLEVYKSLVNHVEIGIYRATPGINGRFLQVNKAMEAITGYSHEELLRIDIEDLYVSPEERSEHIRETLLGSTAKTREVKFKKKDGTHIIVRDKKVAVHSNDGKNLYLDGFLEDISEIKKTEKALRDSEQNLLPQIYLI